MSKKIVSLLIVLVLMLTAMPNIIADTGVTLYVETWGDDSNAGSQAEPLKTLAGAKAKVSQLKSADQTVKEVIFGDGDYYMRNVTFEASDSGESAQPIIYKAKNPGKVNFKGSVVLDMTKATQVTEASALARLQNTVAKNVVELDLTEQGLSQDDIYVIGSTYSATTIPSSGDYNSVYIDGVEASIAQWPNGEKVATWNKAYAYDSSTGAYQDYVKGTNKAVAIGYTDYEPDRWVNAKNWWIGAWSEADWRHIVSVVVELDTAKNIIRTPDNVKYPLSSTQSKAWKAYNLLEELDVPGEFYIDRDTMKLYLYPTAALDAKYELSVENNSLLYMKGANNIAFEGIEFSQARNSAVILQTVNNIDFTDCIFRNVAGCGIDSKIGTYASTGRGYWQQAYTGKNVSYNVDITGCIFDNIGYMGLYLDGGNIDTLAPSNNVVSDCYFNGMNKRRVEGCGVRISGCGITFKNNVLTNTQYCGIRIFGNDHQIYNNEIYDVMRKSGDGGAIYQGGNQLQRGTVISENYIHDVTPIDPIFTVGTCGVYLDEGQQGITVKNNIIVNAKVGFNSNFGAANHFIDNTIVGAGTPWAFHDNQWQAEDYVNPKYAAGPFKVTNMVNYVDKNGTVVYSDAYSTFDELVSVGLETNKDLYFERYPDLKKWITEDIHPKTLNINSGNLAVGAKAPSIKPQEAKYAQWSRTDGVKDDNKIVASTQEFVDPENHDYRLKSNCYLAKSMSGLLNDNNFQMTKIGLQEKQLTFNETTSPYKLTYPTQDQKVAKVGLTLMWNAAFGANSYKVEVSTSPDFSSLVWSDTVRFNHADVPKKHLSVGETYYWRVTAINTSYSQGNEWTCDTAIGRFIVAN